MLAIAPGNPLGDINGYLIALIYCSEFISG